MGLLYLGTPLSWNEAKQYADHVREHGITQFLHTWDRVKDRWGDELLWGDEVNNPSLQFYPLTYLMKGRIYGRYL
jgi:glutamate--cysteine ligase catalytic subunit